MTINRFTSRTKTKGCLMAAMGLTAMLAIACNNTSGSSFKYKIVGETDHLPDNTEIILYQGISQDGTMDDDNKIATMTVHNATFKYEGEGDKPVTGFLYISCENAFMPLFVEEGTIKVFIANDPLDTKVYGTPLNDSLHALAKKNIECSKELQAELNNRHDPPTTQEQKRIQELTLHFRQMVANNYYDCALRNINNELGYFLIASSNELFTREQLVTLLKKLPEDKLKQPEIAELNKPVDKVLPNFTLVNDKGYMMNIKSLVKQNKVTIVDFWASWCRPCINEMPVLASIYKKYCFKGLGIVGISIDKDKEKWVDAIKENNANWLHLWDETGEIADMLNVTAIPHTFIVNNDGEILATKLRGAELEAYVHLLLGQ